MKYSMYIVVGLGLIFYFTKCQSGNELNNTAKQFDDQIRLPRDSIIYTEDTTDCHLLLKVLEKECVKKTSYLNFSILKGIVILVPSDKFHIDCNQFSLEKVNVSIIHQLVNTDSLRSISANPTNPLRTFSIINHIDNNQKKLLELFHSSSGSIYRIELWNNGIGWFIKENLCGKT